MVRGHVWCGTIGYPWTLMLRYVQFSVCWGMLNSRFRLLHNLPRSDRLCGWIVWQKEISNCKMSWKAETSGWSGYLIKLLVKWMDERHIMHILYYCALLGKSLIEGPLFLSNLQTRLINVSWSDDTYSNVKFWQVRSRHGTLEPWSILLLIKRCECEYLSMNYL